MLGLWCLITKCKCKFTSHSRLLAKCLPTLNPAEFGRTHYPRPTPCAAGVQALRREKAALTPLKGNNEDGSRFFKGDRDAMGEGVKKIALPSAVKRGIIDASGRRLLRHLAYSIPRKSHLVIRRGGKGSNQTPIQAPFSDSPCWLGWSHLMVNT